METRKRRLPTESSAARRPPRAHRSSACGLSPAPEHVGEGVDPRARRG